MTKQVQQLDRVVIRFAGDSGDGMQLTGDRFTQETAVVRQRPVDPAELPGRDPRPSRAPCPACLSFQLHFADHDILTPGDAPRRAGRDEPGRAEGEPRRPAARRRRSSSTPTTSPRARLARVGYETNPLEDGSLDGYNVHALALTSHDGRGARRRSSCREGRRARRRTCSRSACCPGSTTGPTEGTITFLASKFAKQARHPRRQHRRVPGRLELRRDHRGVRGLLRDQAGPAAGGHATATSPATWPWPTAWSPRPGRPSCRCSSAPTRSRRPRTSCTSCPSTSASACAPSRPRTRSPAIGAALGRRVRWLARRDDDLRSGHRAEGRDDRAGRVARAAAGHLSTSSAAGRRPACRPRPSSPTCCRRCSAATARRRCRSIAPQSPGRLLRRRDRGGPDRARPTGPRCSCCPTATWPTAPSRGGCRTSTTLPDLTGRVRRPSPTAPARDGPFLPYLRDPETLARPWASRAPPGLEHRIGGIEKADGTGNISYDPDNHDFMVRTRQAKVDGIAPTSPTLEVDDPSGDGRACWCSAGARPTARSARPAAGCGKRGGSSRAGAPAPPEPVPGQPRRGAARATTGSSIPEMNLGQLALLIRAQVPGRRDRLQPGPRPAVQGRPELAGVDPRHCDRAMPEPR